MGFRDVDACDVPASIARIDPGRLSRVLEDLYTQLPEARIGL